MKIPIKFQDWFRNTKLRYSEIHSGNHTDNSGMILGMIAGPQKPKIYTLLHEMSHFIEIDDKRCLVYGWGLEFPRVWIYDRYCTEPNTCQGSVREMRVVAIQMKIAEHLGVSSNWVGHLDAIESFLSDSCHLSTFFDVPEDKKYKNEFRGGLIKCMKKYTKFLASRININDVWNEWQRKCAIHDMNY